MGCRPFLVKWLWLCHSVKWGPKGPDYVTVLSLAHHGHLSHLEQDTKGSGEKRDRMGT